MSTHSEPTVSLRPLTEDDLNQVLLIESKSHPDPWKKAHFEAEIQKPFTRVLVLTDDETDTIVIGYIIYWLQAEGVSLMNITVDPNWRGFGFGNKLMQAMIKEAVAEDISRIILEVRASNESAIQLYEKIGFKVTHQRKNFYSNGETALVMEIQTSEASGSIN